MVTGATAALSDTSAIALLAALQSQLQAPAPAPQVQPPAPLREPGTGEGWDLPERRKFRYRLEDVAY
ncbi:hypothetical protein [Duganella sp. BuS-21]|uniref:hypothetical protein n=1 Tax=Duganella sp. BuS-21 TaxID=2943848 RepID=UPI0035A638BB